MSVTITGSPIIVSVNTAATTFTTVAFTVAAGDAIVIWWSPPYAPTTMSVSDSLGNTWQTTAYPSVAYRVISRCLITNAGSCQVTFTANTATTFYGILQLFSGVLSVGTPSTNQSQVNNTSPLSSPAQTVAPGDMVVGMFQQTNNPPTFVAGGNSTLIGTVSNTGFYVWAGMSAVSAATAGSLSAQIGFTPTSTYQQLSLDSILLVAAPVVPVGFNVSLSPTALTVQAGTASSPVTVTLAASGGYVFTGTSMVFPDANFIPSGMTFSASPNPLPAGTLSTTLTMIPMPMLAPGIYSIPIWGINNNINQSLNSPTLTVTVTAPGPIAAGNGGGSSLTANVTSTTVAVSWNVGDTCVICANTWNLATQPTISSPASITPTFLYGTAGQSYQWMWIISNAPTAFNGNITVTRSTSGILGVVAQVYSNVVSYVTQNANPIAVGQSSPQGSPPATTFIANSWVVSAFAGSTGSLNDFTYTNARQTSAVVISSIGYRQALNDFVVQGPTNWGQVLQTWSSSGAIPSSNTGLTVMLLPYGNPVTDVGFANLTVSAAFANSTPVVVAAGDLILVSVMGSSGWTGTQMGVADNIGNTYTLIPATSSDVAAYAYVFSAVSSPNCIVTLSRGAGAAINYAGIVKVYPGITNVGVQTATSSLSSSPGTTPTMNLNAGDVMFSTFAGSLTNGGILSGTNRFVGYTVSGATTFSRMLACDNVASSAGSFSNSATWSGAGGVNANSIPLFMTQPDFSLGASPGNVSIEQALP